MTRPLTRPRAHRGFTLVEVMITVAIVAILASIALPAYNRYIERGRVQEGLQGLAESRTKMEQYYMDNRVYDCGAALTTAGQFDISCDDGADGDTYTVTATGRDTMTGFTYTINAQGAKTSTFTDRGGWGSGGSCWITKPGETC